LVTYKNIRVKMKNGKTRLQRVQVLANGKYKFVKNIGSKVKKAATRKKSSTKRSSPKKVKTVGKNKFFKNMSGVGAVEDALVGYVGLSVLSPAYGAAVALPMTRTLQGIAGHALNRRGKGRLMYGIIDLIDLYLAGQWAPSGVLTKTGTKPISAFF